MARLYADEDFPSGAVDILRDLGHDVDSVHDAGRMGGEDAAVLAEAISAGRAVLTHNHRHFRKVHRTHQPHAGIISCTRDDNDLGGLARRIHDTIVVIPDLANQFVRVVRPNAQGEL